ncbi:hypothetical protein [Amycolatopsis marina]|uniref:hypothetical protein n=1 Tax=Amycolatopsis marina TaxID=490629 RepID=UPI0011600EEB|nr:hypothetical protein [Amycolatopsis marina]
MGESVPDLDWVLENVEFRDIEHHPTYGPLLEQLLVKRFRAKMSQRALADRFGFPLSGVRRVLRRGGVTTCPQPEPTATPPPTSTDLDSCSDLDAPWPLCRTRGIFSGRDDHGTAVSGNPGPVRHRHWRGNAVRAQSSGVDPQRDAT